MHSNAGIHPSGLGSGFFIAQAIPGLKGNGPLRIHEKYELEVIPIGIGGKRLELYGVGNWDRFIQHLERKGLGDLSDFPFWIKFWEASFVLAEYLLSLRLDTASKILEIGAGMGVVGLFLGAFGYPVTITDYDEDVLDLLRANVSRNRIDTVSVRKLDWLKPDLDTSYDVICGSEVIYKEVFFDPLLDMFQSCLWPTGRIVLAHNIQHRCIIRYIDTLPSRYDIHTQTKTLRNPQQTHRILLHELRLRVG